MKENFYQFRDEKTYIKIRATTGSSKNSITGIKNGELLICVTSMPENNKANTAIVEIISDTLNIAKSKIKVISGMKCRNKLICIDAKLVNIEDFSW